MGVRPEQTSGSVEATRCGESGWKTRRLAVGPSTNGHVDIQELGYQRAPRKAKRGAYLESGVDLIRSVGAGTAGPVTARDTGPAGAHPDQIAIAVTNTAPATMAATASASTRLISFGMAWNRTPAGRITW